MPEHRPPAAPHDSHRRQGVCCHLEADRSEQQTRETASTPRADHEHVRTGALLAQRSGRRVANQQRSCSHGRIACLSAPHSQIEDFSSVLARRINRANRLERCRHVGSISFRRCVSACPGVADGQRKAPQPSLTYGPVEGLRAAPGPVVASNDPTSARLHDKPPSASQRFLTDTALAQSIFLTAPVLPPWLVLPGQLADRTFRSPQVGRQRRGEPTVREADGPLLPGLRAGDGLQVSAGERLPAIGTDCSAAAAQHLATLFLYPGGAARPLFPLSLATTSPF